MAGTGTAATGTLSEGSQQYKKLYIEYIPSSMTDTEIKMTKRVREMTVTYCNILPTWVKRGREPRDIMTCPRTRCGGDDDDAQKWPAMSCHMHDDV